MLKRNRLDGNKLNHLSVKEYPVKNSMFCSKVSEVLTGITVLGWMKDRRKKRRRQQMFPMSVNS